MGFDIISKVLNYINLPGDCESPFDAGSAAPDPAKTKALRNKGVIFLFGTQSYGSGKPLFVFSFQCPGTDQGND
jgi:hypothetical protein